MEATTRSIRYKGHLYKGQLIKMLISSCETLTLRSLSSIRRSPLKNIWRVAEQSSLPLAERLLPCRGLRGSAESILTLKNRESIHFGFFGDRLR